MNTNASCWNNHEHITSSVNTFFVSGMEKTTQTICFLQESGYAETISHAGDEIVPLFSSNLSNLNEGRFMPITSNHMDLINLFNGEKTFSDYL